MRFASAIITVASFFAMTAIASPAVSPGDSALLSRAAAGTNLAHRKRQDFQLLNGILSGILGWKRQWKSWRALNKCAEMLLSLCARWRWKEWMDGG
ncbi:hypothetical protein GALMADRAFT_138081 [Galerina marginata CBS 339.88]|uniref:RxLR effector protein n=1 Tax=Galerina marginata (strain CBS 339.88) TaxID=685588 RepID=A0A067T6E0_GALM3|nr:hypothetical protein GALMADRAFT_138081 [Galerina marginata CBS 339.88]